jgi:hypothetical protein
MRLFGVALEILAERLEKDGGQLDRSCAKLGSITQSQEGEQYLTHS